ncbi:unnamed protein product [Protopolystoma xenopodis]|uniref:Uncharacterized protein n=1 Tax=Protopolystoma xenopodis TaxID=117903 RepID=A0A448X8R3_9PLAT|nr:unnamed protein product [Protopolystoma xenopodis]
MIIYFIPDISLIQQSYWPVLTHFISLFIVGVCVFGGIKWIEKANIILVPLLLLIITITFCWSLTRQYADVGIKFLFTPDWSKLHCDQASEI